VSHIQATVRRTLRRIGGAVLYGFAAIYFIIDLAFLSFIRPLRHRLLGSGRLHAWIEGLNRCVALSLVLVPLAILEPVKPVAFYLTPKGQVLSGGAVLILGESLVEQVIEITKPKLMSFRWFAWAYGQWEAVMDRLRSIEAWQAIRRQFHAIVARVRRIKAQMETR